jgi:hypothetical protein
MAMIINGRCVTACAGPSPIEPSPDLPEICVAVLRPDDKLIGIKRGERGYFEMYDGMVAGHAARVANRINRALNPSRKDCRKAWLRAAAG